MVLCTFTKGQNVSIDELISLRTQPLGSVEEFLTPRKWTMLSANEGDYKSMVTFAYKKSLDNDTAHSFLYLYYISDTPNRLGIQVHLATTYNLYMARIKALGYKLTKSFIDDGSIIKVYEANGSTIQIKTTTQEQDSATKNYYKFMFFYSLDYKFMYGK